MSSSIFDYFSQLPPLNHKLFRIIYALWDLYYSCAINNSEVRFANISQNTRRTFTNIHFSFSGGSCVDFITPVQTEVYRTSGDKVTLSCNYSSALSLYWYRQYPRSSPHCLLLILQNSGESQIMQPGMSVKLNEKKKSVDLEIYSVKASDSAVYYCALKPTVRGNPTALYKNLNLAWQSVFKYWKIY